MPYKRKIIGIYCITNVVNNKKYIGSATHCLHRFSTHKRLLKNNNHFNNHLQASYNKYGVDNFTFEVIFTFDKLDKNLLLTTESEYIIKFKTTDNNFGYNKRIFVDSNLGIKASEESKEKMRKAHLGVKHPQWRRDLKAITQSKKVYQYDLKGNFIKEWSSIKQAAEELNICKNSISLCCRGILRKYNNYLWQFNKVDKAIMREHRSKGKTLSEIRNKKKMKRLFLDDIRIPSDCVFYMHTRIGSENSVYLEQDWIVVKSFNEFVEYIIKQGIPDLISFDHDLATEHYEHTIDSVENWEEYHQYSYREYTGYDALMWLINYCKKYNNFKYPKMIVHSMNPVGTEKMLKQINGFN